MQNSPARLLAVLSLVALGACKKEEPPAAPATPPAAAPAATTPAAPAAPVAGTPGVTDDITVDGIRACMKNNLVERGSLRDLEMIVTDREGKQRTLKLKLYWKPSAEKAARLTLHVTEPADVAGAGLLVVEKPGAGEDIWVHLPAAGGAQKITGEDGTQPLWGTDFSYAEIKQVQGLLLDGTVTRTADQELFGRQAYTLEIATSAEATGYTRAVSLIDKTSCTLLQTEFYAQGSTTPAKRMEADPTTLLQVDEYWLVLGYTMRNLVQGSQTRLNLSDLYLMESLADTAFDPAHFWEPVGDEGRVTAVE